MYGVKMVPWNSKKSICVKSKLGETQYDQKFVLYSDKSGTETIGLLTGTTV